MDEDKTCNGRHHRKTIGKRWLNGGLMGFNGIYPLVNVDRTMENHHVYIIIFNGKLHYKWQCSIAMLNYPVMWELSIALLKVVLSKILLRVRSLRSARKQWEKLSTGERVLKRETTNNQGIQYKASTSKNSPVVNGGSDGANLGYPYSRNIFPMNNWERFGAT